MEIWDHLKSWLHRKEAEKFASKARNKTAIRVVDFDEDAQFLNILMTTVGTTAVLIEVPENVNEYTIFHQTEDGIVFWGEDENVTTSSVELADGDVIEISGKKDFEIYAITATGTVDVYVVATVKD